MSAKQEALAELDVIDPSNIVETSGRPRRAAAAKVDYKAFLAGTSGSESSSEDEVGEANAPAPAAPADVQKRRLRVIESDED